MKKRIIIPVLVGIILVAIIIAFGQMFTVRFVTVEFLNDVSSANKQQIIELANIDTHTNIFVVDETAIADNIQNSFDDHQIKVNDIVRTFPNKVTIKVSERISIYKIKVENAKENGFVAVDRNFQRTAIKTEEELADSILITVNGFTVEDTYKISQCYALRDIASAFILCGIDEEALPYFIKSVEFVGDSINIVLRANNCSFVILHNNKDISQTIIELYQQYSETIMAERDGKVFSI